MAQVIIRRKHTANFTTIGNILFNDERLEADELGILAFLLSRPDDWEVRRPALARRFQIGRDSIKRIIQNCVRLGWMIPNRTRLSNGTFHTVYEVRDEPGPELTIEEVRAALSSVSVDAASDENEGNQGEDSPVQPPTEKPSWSADNPPSTTGLPATADPATANPLRPSKDLLNTDSQKTESTKGVRAFSEVKSAWPSAHILSELACEKLHAEMTDEHKEASYSGIASYLADCKAQNRKVCDLATYQRERRWERLLAKVPKGEPTIIVPGTPNWWRWHEHHQQTDGKRAEAMETFKKMGRDWYEQAPWPPAKGASPPGDHLTEEDVNEFLKRA